MNAVIETLRLILRHFRGRGSRCTGSANGECRLHALFERSFHSRITAGFLFERVIAPTHAGSPSQFALIFHEENGLIGYCGFFRQILDGVNEIEIGYRLHPD